jgi:hypothetical protein
MTLKAKIFTTISVIIIVYSQSTIIYEDFFVDRSYVRECLVLGKIDYVKETKHKSHSSYYPEKVFQIKWLDNNQITELPVTNETFYNRSVGEKVFFTQYKPKYTHTSDWIPQIHLLIFIIGISIEVVLLVAGIGYFISWIFDIKW